MEVLARAVPVWLTVPMCLGWQTEGAWSTGWAGQMEWVWSTGCARHDPMTDSSMTGRDFG